MNEEVAFPAYIQRQEEQRLRQAAAKVQRDKDHSRAVLLYGPGGAGKTLLIRELAGHGGAAHGGTTI